MTLQLPIDCLDEIFEYLEEDYITLHSCLLVNRLWCEITVRILWRNVWNLKYSIGHNSYRTHVPLAIIGTLIACLPDESKDLLNKNGIFISTLTSKPLFNYASFTRVLSINEFNEMIQHVLKNQSSITSLSLDYNKHLLEQEIIKMFMNQIPSLKKLCYHQNNLHFTYFPGARDCLTKLSELYCGSDVDSHFFYQLSQICSNLQSLIIEFRNPISFGLSDFIFVQKNLKYLKLLSYKMMGRRTGLALQSLSNLFNPLINKLKLIGEDDRMKTFFTSLRQLDLSFIRKISFEVLQNINFPNLQILKIRMIQPNDDLLIKFFENNGKNLKELYMDNIHNSLGLSISKFCPNLRKISSILTNDDLLTLKNIFINCQYLESIEICYDFLSNQSSEKKILEIILKHSQKYFYELKLYHYSSNLVSEDLENFFLNWKNRIPKNSLNLSINVKNRFMNNNNNNNNRSLDKGIMKVIDKYKKLGIIKKFDTY
ncbi:hypothetical protein RclHR1_01990022 [Rhizophagus clarus]|uniref:F-box domain-containing protein n=1 Tax=Rhizophagus clarus TaxID=94130 RepID=A0A2Z6QQ96_9GLOM|nr:hypothetical protein RclHR1_01990022 [Rhizophagus clarus]GES72980.1 hypothetical protein GLOIN_2v1784405 [Rhizophagus clarus]